MLVWEKHCVIKDFVLIFEISKEASDPQYRYAVR